MESGSRSTNGGSQAEKRGTRTESRGRERRVGGKAETRTRDVRNAFGGRERTRGGNAEGIGDGFKVDDGIVGSGKTEMGTESGGNGKGETEEKRRRCDKYSSRLERLESEEGVQGRVDAENVEEEEGSAREEDQSDYIRPETDGEGEESGVDDAEDR